MENELLARIEAQEVKLEKIWISVEKTRKYLLISVWITVIMFVLPLLIAVIAVPMFINSYLGAFEGLI